MTTANDNTTIKTQEHTEFGSDLLGQLAEIASSAHNASVEKQTVPAPGTKGVLLTGLVIHLTGSMIFELLKLAAKRLVNHPFYDPLISLNINGRALTLQDVVDDK